MDPSSSSSHESSKPRGVMYMSRVPPRLKPQRLRSLLESARLGNVKVTRLYLKPSSSLASSSSSSSLKSSKVKSKSANKTFSEGWIELSRRRDARQLADLLNGQPMGGRRRAANYSDLWNLKYLKGFTWDQLSAEQAYKSRARESRIANEVANAKAERDAFAEAVRRGKAEKAMAERRAKNNNNNDNNKANKAAAAADARVLRTFSQRAAVGGDDDRFGGGKTTSKQTRTAVGGNVSKTLLARMFE